MREREGEREEKKKTKEKKFSVGFLYHNHHLVSRNPIPNLKALLLLF